MMNNTHKNFATLLMLLLAKRMGWPILTPTILARMTSSLPDIDHPKSRIGRKVKRVSRAINSRFGHRTITHSIVGLGIFSFPVYLISYCFNINSFYASCLVFGYLSHLIGDQLTIYGIKWFWPYQNKVGGILKVGSMEEELLNVFFGLIIIKEVIEIWI